MRAAFYKGTRPGIAGIYNRLVRWWTRSQYSHVELVFSDGMAGSASFEDGGVRLKHITFDISKWDFVELPIDLEPFARDWFDGLQGFKYDVLGNIRFVLPFLPDCGDKWFCSEAVGEALGLLTPVYYHPASLLSALTIFNRRRNSAYVRTVARG